MEIDTAERSLLTESGSPYLAEHADNLVAWRPFGDAAFDKAKAESKPVFLSIGYSACHWCHVMERESYRDASVAEAINRSFVPVLVDREQRPDVDAVYMAACQQMTGQGGWPLTAILTPAGQPFFVATYLTRARLLAVLKEVTAQWEKRRDKVIETGARLSRAVREQFDAKWEPAEVDPRAFHNAVRAYASAFDAEWGGIGDAPKFPMPHTAAFLIRYARIAANARALSMAETSLLRMCEGGVFDHVGGGFMRYATDRRWAEPHYEKMLNDNALLAQAYMEAWRATDRAVYRSVAERTLAYVLREMTDDAGCFFTSQDADANGVEGAFYLLSRKELVALLGKEDGAAYAAYFGVRDHSLPHRIGYDGGIETMRMAALSEQVRAYRSERMPLGRDDKVIAAWNGAMITALADAYGATGDARWLDAATRAAVSLSERLERIEGGMAHAWHGGKASGEGLLDDYAEVANGSIALYRATLEERWLVHAVSLARTMLERFEDHEKGGFYLTPADGEALPARPKETYDGAHPSGNSAALLTLSSLAALDIGDGWTQAAARQLRFLSGEMADAPLQHMAALSAALPLVFAPALLESRAGAQENEALLAALRGRYDPLLFVKGNPPAPGGSRWRLCKGATCLPAFERVEEAIAAL